MLDKTVENKLRHITQNSTKGKRKEQSQSLVLIQGTQLYALADARIIKKKSTDKKERRHVDMPYKTADLVYKQIVLASRCIQQPHMIHQHHHNSNSLSNRYPMNMTLL